jgi:hypothetical protein
VTGLWAPGLARAELAWLVPTVVLTAIAVAAGAAAADGRAGAALVWVIQEGLARSFAGHRAPRTDWPAPRTDWSGRCRRTGH